MSKRIFIILLSSVMLLSSCSITKNNINTTSSTVSTDEPNIEYSSDNQLSEYDKMLSTIDYDKKLPFGDAAGYTTFYELLKVHRANVYDYNKAYVIATGVGAGTQSGTIYQTSDGGETWIKTKDSFPFYGSGKSFKNGKILCMGQNHNVHTNPQVYIFDIDKETDQVNLKMPQDWFSIFNIDGNIIFDVKTSAVYQFDYIIHITITETDMYGEKINVLYNGDVILDPDTLYPKELKS